jgi:hypothetical protein
LAKSICDGLVEADDLDACSSFREQAATCSGGSSSSSGAGSGN